EQPLMMHTKPNVSDAHQLIREGPRMFRVSGRAYVDRTVFDMEMERIFSKTWVFMAHESEIPQPGDFKTAHIGTQPMIVTRAPDMQIHVLANRCVHRGASVCRERSGNTRVFLCPYHAWTYDLTGRLTSIPGRDDPNGYTEDFEQPEGLFSVPRVE